MAAYHRKFVVDAHDRHEGVFLSMAEWERLVEELEELADIRAYDAAKSGPQDAVPFERAIREIDCDEAR